MGIRVNLKISNQGWSTKLLTTLKEAEAVDLLLPADMELIAAYSSKAHALLTTQDRLLRQEEVAEGTPSTFHAIRERSVHTWQKARVGFHTITSVLLALVLVQSTPAQA